MDVLATHAAVHDAIERVRSERAPLLVEAVTYRFRGHSMADPEEYRTKEEVAHWRERDPITTFGGRLRDDGVIDQTSLEALDEEAKAAVEQAVEFAEASPFPAPESLYEGVYVLGDQLHGVYSVDTTHVGGGSPETASVGKR
jgi:pyruvate dehydrogenase E1 component alpha subunit